MRFECQPGCTACCEKQGFVYLTEEDIGRAAEFLGMSRKSFEKRYVYRTRNTRRLRTPRHSPCVFLRDRTSTGAKTASAGSTGGCAIHPAKPTQCRVFPFWPELVESKREWHKTAAWCPGIGKGELVQIERAGEQAAEMRAAYPHMYR